MVPWQRSTDFSEEIGTHHSVALHAGCLLHTCAHDVANFRPGDIDPPFVRRALGHSAGGPSGKVVSVLTPVLPRADADVAHDPSAVGMQLVDAASERVDTPVRRCMRKECLCRLG